MFFVTFLLSVLITIWQQNITGSEYLNINILFPVSYINDRFLHRRHLMWLTFLIDISIYIILITLYLGYYISIDFEYSSITISLKPQF